MVLWCFCGGVRGVVRWCFCGGVCRVMFCGGGVGGVFVVVW